MCVCVCVCGAMGRVCRGRAGEPSTGCCKTVVHVGRETETQTTYILECSSNLTSARRTAVVRNLVDVRAGNSEG